MAGEIKRLTFSDGITVTSTTTIQTDSKTYAVSFSAESSKSIDVSTEGFDAQRCSVEILDDSGNYVTASFDVTRPDSDTITLTAAAAITDTFTAIVIQGKS